MKTLSNFRLFVCIAFLLSASCGLSAQDMEPVKRQTRNYFEVELAAPLKQNEAFGDDDDENFLRASGAYLRAGFGRRVTDWMLLGLHTGIEWKSDPGLVSAPVFGNVKVAPRVSQDDELRPFASFGYGKVFVLNQNRFSGDFLRGNLGLDVAVLDDEEGHQKGMFSVFIEISYYHFKPVDFESLSTFNIGLGYTFL
ncbi:hypothetical protein [Flavobacterium sp.]|uniref:hypothetical protein n=1 Tax=Flavobacterium sp. TaxID=239 RepID=UPI00260404A2|nr:hypothetical protein [Flavobacterium sp.]